MMDYLKDFFSGMLEPVKMVKIEVMDCVEILIIAILIYNIIKWMKNTRAWVLMKGVVVLFVFYMIAALLNFDVILWIFQNGIAVSITAAIILFQPELRKALEQLGKRNIGLVTPLFGNNQAEEKFSEETINGIIKATFDMAKVKTGALMIIEGEQRLDDIEATGIMIDAKISSELIINIFEHNTPLHDGAVVIRGNRITAATCYLPLTDSTKISKELGTRHRAAVGISEVTDSFTIVVSEQTGAVSVAQNGELSRRVTREFLYDRLKEIQNRMNEDTTKKKKGILRIGKNDKSAKKAER
ncbi:MAG: diadenylate cyclase CdaA [Lachnospiraceae bacterium]|nr:diadenylate cyclase CdaA [Lachnospiraceae bacterium]MBQ6025070.1 diadenylate cyclase CdaA [Lachnospiraceae bacterium]MBR3581462.1 diadenylate cyclase CdaA [Lachnospiraceae bacterium]MBR4542281.1 diadenylate cyclase CdaA [Lachnospiraceae bacterium]